MKRFFGEMNNIPRANTLLILLLLLLLLLFLLIILPFIVITLIVAILLQTAFHRAIHIVQQSSDIARSVIAQHEECPVPFKIKPRFSASAVPRAIMLSSTFTVDFVDHPAAGVPSGVKSIECNSCEPHTRRCNNNSRAVFLSVVVCRASVIQSPDVEQYRPQMLWQHGTQSAQISLHISQAGENVTIPVHYSVLPAHCNVFVTFASKRRIAAVLLAASAVPADYNITSYIDTRRENKNTLRYTENHAS
jgi:hypothetical protein